MGLGEVSAAQVVEPGAGRPISATIQAAHSENFWKICPVFHWSQAEWVYNQAKVIQGKRFDNFLKGGL